MEFVYGGSKANQKTVLGHPSGLFVLFFTEMWERFSFYGMRVLLVNFLTMAITGVNNPGWGWSAEQAGALFGTYAGLLYITPILGGIIADKLTGYKWAVVIGAFIMTLGHASMALETETSLYIGLTLLVLGTGFFKPNMTSIISEMYTKVPEKKDGAYTIYYMGVNAGAFFGMMLCGYLAETQGWAYGFGLAGIFMLFGTLQFWLAAPLFGEIGEVPKKEKSMTKATEKTNHFTNIDKILIAVSSVIGLLYLLNDPSSKIANINLLPEVFLGISEHLSGPTELIIIGLFIFLFLVISRIIRYEKVVRDRMVALIVFALFTVFFWMSFEQGATSLIIFARDYTQRELVGNYAIIFNIINTLLTVIPLAIISWVLWLLYKQTHNTIKTSNWILILSFLAIWIVVGGMLYREFSADVTTVTVAWFSTLNSFFIIAFASFFSKWWESKYNPTSAQKYGLGLVLLGIGFAFLSYGANRIPSDAVAGSVKVSMIWLIMAYLFHTLGELCLSPLGLSQVSKLVPAKMIGFMYGMWYLAIAIGNKLAGSLGGKIEAITEAYDLSTFFLIFTIVPIVAGIIITLLNKTLVRKMHGIQ
ncbi:peptide MFS transporter [Wenyingzhuangia aestuarii]|uniref:peptide MFS transporter n=1 Tax=Wenyingzhuangia aestuarii TaxID=1647582 RepID=UPI0014394162|nr:peptide MFS transporter [Wenyingzhuangia aestuarii]NJB83805.1 POT family proton-dependent oligopeptide transporter [Wenyingzhuangia aestuarii]